MAPAPGQEPGGPAPAPPRPGPCHPDLGAAAAPPPPLKASSRAVLHSCQRVISGSAQIAPWGHSPGRCGSPAEPPTPKAHVTLAPDAIQGAADSITDADLGELLHPAAFDPDLHFLDPGRPALTAQYLLVVDALNFCFWPEPGLEYEHLSRGLKAAVAADPSCISAESLSRANGATVRAFFGSWPREVPLQDERARLLRELGSGLLQHFGGEAANLVQAAGGSALELVQLVAMHFPGFRDHAIYRGHQVFFYKRAQIFAGDLFGAFQGRGLGEFHDIDQITMFADYRVPVVLRDMGVLRYSPELAARVQAGVELNPGSEEEIQIRAATVVAVELIRQALCRRLVASRQQHDAGTAPASTATPDSATPDPGPEPEPGAAGGGPKAPNAVQLDWWLWTRGEKRRSEQPHHHRTLTIFY